MKVYNFITKELNKIDFRIEEDDSNDNIIIECSVNGDLMRVEAEYPFVALQKLRRLLLPKNIDLQCFGALKNVYPSPMMMISNKAYVLTIGQPAKADSVVNIFDYAENRRLQTVEEQNLYYRQWLESLR